MNTLTDTDIIYLTRLLGHHSTGGGDAERIFMKLADYCDRRGLEFEKPLPLELATASAMIYGARLIFTMASPETAEKVDHD